MVFDYMDYFVSMSVGLTGFSSEAIASPFASIDIKAAYLAAFEENLPSGMAEQILERYKTLFVAGGSKPGSEEQIVGQMLGGSGTSAAQVFAMRQLIFLWYAGAWPTVADTGSPTHGQTFSTVLSADSYTLGLVWRVMQSHPMGSTTYNYGYWASVPAPLSAYLENPV
ncbi:hypothetical protein J5226_06625 [Lysobacter sp. K5869]|uniref:hypothetical protein n=1 Tax=Lysobacter sp. K5869 TaxID=2820808 RepID=UPI001C0620AA|nr:hypothetical protein [Lysobacter sp. K5869]QWP78066.1 hypothetical protein J5226_06625 [Lysobacter sp. K5869]